MRLKIRHLVVNVFFECRYDLLKPTKFILDGSVGLGHRFDDDSFNFLNFGSVVIELCLYCFLPRVDTFLDSVHHLFQFLILLCQQSLLVRKRNNILLFSPFNYVIHGSQPFLDVVIHPLLPLQR